jgi:hypothetical protein
MAPPFIPVPTSECRRAHAPRAARHTRTKSKGLPAGSNLSKMGLPTRGMLLPSDRPSRDLVGGQPMFPRRPRRDRAPQWFGDMAATALRCT